MDNVIEMKSVSSSQVDSLGYDQIKNTLAVKFKTGVTYHYHNVSNETYHLLLKAKSVGSFLHTNIKPHHLYVKV